MFLRRRRHEFPCSDVRGSGPARSRPCHGQCRHDVRAQGGSMNEELLLFNMLDMAGTFAFAISGAVAARQKNLDLFGIIAIAYRSEEHTSELQSLMRNSYAVFCLTNK